MKDLNELNIEIELIKKDINDIKNNHLEQIETDMKDIKREIFRFKYIVYGMLIVFLIISDNIKEIFNLIQEITMCPMGKGTYGSKVGRPPKFKKKKKNGKKKKK